MGTEKVDVLRGEAEPGHNALFVVAKDPIAVCDLHMGDGGGPGSGLEVGDIHTFGGHGGAHEGPILVCTHHAGVGGFAPQPEGIDGHINRISAGVGLPGPVVDVHAVVAHGGQLDFFVHWRHPFLMGEQSPHALEGLLGVQGGLIAVGCHQLDGGPAPVPPDLQLLQQLRQGDAAVAWDQMAVAVPIAVHQMEVGHPPAQLIQIVRDGLPDDPGGHHIAHTHKSGRIHRLQRLGQLPGSGADIGLIGGEGLQQNGVADGLGVIRQFPEEVNGCR